MGRSNIYNKIITITKLLNGTAVDTSDKIASHKLENSEQNFLGLLEPIAVPIAFTNFRGRFTYVNEELAKLLGYSIKELIGRPFKDFIHPNERSNLLRLFFNIVALPRQPRVLEFRAIRKDGTILNLWSKPSKLVINGKTKGFQAIILDVTEFKKTEQSLRQSENNHKTTLTFLGNILGNISDAVTVVDENYTYRFLNESAKKVLGNVNGEKCYKILRNRESPCYHIGIPCEVYEVLEKNKPSFAITRRAGNTDKILEIHATPMIETNGKRNVIVASRDVTEEKNAIEKLQKSFAQLNATLESTADGILVTDENGKITNYNQKFVEILNIPKSILKSLDDKILIEWCKTQVNDPEKFEKNTDKMIANPDIQQNDILELTNGQIIKRHCQPQRLENKTIGRVLSFRDITKRKMAEKKLCESEEFNSSLMENSLNPILVVNPDTSIRYVNPALENLTGYSKSELIGTKPPFPWWAKDAIKDLSTKLEKNMHHGLRHYEENFKTKNGEDFWVEINANSITKDGELKHFLSTWVDITQRKQMENELRTYSDHLTELVEEKSRELAISERFLKTTIDSIPDHMFIKDRNLKFILVNNSYCKFHGKSKEEILNRNVHDLYPKEMADILESQDRQIFKKSLILNMSDFPLKDSNGSIHRVHTIKVPLKDLQGKVTHLLGIARDITQLKQAEEQLERIYNLSLDMICVADFNGYFTKVNPAFEQVLGYTQQELLSKPFIDLVHPEDRKSTQDMINQKLSKGYEAIDFQNRYRCKNSEYKWFSWTARSIPEEGIIIAVARDITEYKKLEKFKEQIISTTTHELRTPLVSILAYLNLAISGKLGTLNKNLENGLQIVNRNANRLLKITNDLLDIRKIESGRLQLNLEAIDLKDIIEDSVKEILPLIDGKEQEFHIELPKKHLMIKGDRTRLCQVLMNILGNANKFTSERGKITLQAKERKKTIQVKISDTGIGIKKEDIKHAFTPFANIQKANDIKGTGLGLSLSKGLIEAHGGKIRIKSEGEGKGATFTLSLPKSS